MAILARTKIAGLLDQKTRFFLDEQRLVLSLSVRWWGRGVLSAPHGLLAQPERTIPAAKASHRGGPERLR